MRPSRASPATQELAARVLDALAQHEPQSSAGLARVLSVADDAVSISRVGTACASLAKQGAVARVAQAANASMWRRARPATTAPRPVAEPKTRRLRRWLDARLVETGVRELREGRERLLGALAHKPE